MPGIAGIISKGSPGRNKELLDIMINCMLHEPFYTSGTYVNNQLGLYAGWVCHKGSFSDCMPTFNEKKDLVLLFSGENFVDKEVTNKLKSNGHEFDSSNASYLIHLYEDDEDRFLQSLNGWFSGVLLDVRKSKGILFNDRYGMKRIYYHESKDALYFSSEAKALLKIIPSLRNIDMESLAQFFTFRCVLQNRTYFPEVFLLPGGSAWTFRNGNIGKKEYYLKPDVWENQTILKKEPFYEKLSMTFRNILPRYFDSNEKIGISLTGGLDSKLIISCADAAPGTLPCYTFGSIYRDSLDVRIARKIAKVCNQNHKTLRLDREFIANFPSYAEKTIYLTDGLFDVCGTHEIYLNRLAREIAPIRMTGLFGSEIARIDPLLNENSLSEEYFHPDFKEYIRKAKETLVNVKKGHKVSAIAFKEVPWLHSGPVIAAQSQLTYRTPFLDNDIVGMMYQASPDDFSPDENFLRIIEDSNPAISRIRTKTGIGGKSSTLVSKFVHLLYKSIVFADWYYNWVMPNWLLKIDKNLAPLHAERLILGLDQYLFYRMWFGNDLSGYIKDILLDTRSTKRPYLKKGTLEKIVCGHIKGKSNYTNEIRKMLTIELIQRLLIEEN